MAFQLEFRGLTAHKLGQLVVHDLHQQLARLHCRKHVLAQRLGLDAVRESLGHLVVDVGVEQGAPNVFQGFGDVDFGDAAFTFKDLERPFKSLG